MYTGGGFSFGAELHPPLIRCVHDQVVFQCVHFQGANVSCENVVRRVKAVQIGANSQVGVARRVEINLEVNAS